MNNPVVLITGALTGIGRAAAVAFAQKGAKVVVAGRRDEAGRALAKELRSLGSEAEFINADVRKDDDVRALVYKTVARFGKHAVEGITKSVALEIVGSGIRVNAVAPGPVDTGMLTRFTGTPENMAALATTVPMGRLGLSEEQANAIVFLASNEASFITGHILNVDGGKSL
jgi:NAD(P)-dependent dehydrogenase (short-subunit alcohol dehydrogenase family)